ncbi:arsenate reductase ArsC [Nocardia sp. Marseille-Q1738]
MSHKPSVLFVCVENAGPSQMAAGLLTTLAGERFDVRSAGSAPAETLDATVVDAMAEIGIDISGYTPKPLTMDAVGISDVVITMGCGDACPFFPGISYRDWVLPDPAGQTIDVVRTIRDRIRILVENLIAELVPAPAR